MPGKGLKEASDMVTNDGDYSLSLDGRTLVGRTREAAIAMKAAMENPVFPFTLASWEKDYSLILRFNKILNPFEVKRVLNNYAQWEE